MTKKAKMPTDLNSRAKAIVALATGDEVDSDPDADKDPVAVMRGRKGGRRGGAARRDSLTADERSEIARKAAQARWANR